MTTVENALAAWATAATQEQLDQGPSISDLGGMDAVLVEALSLAKPRSVDRPRG
ncbi:hypothetical protein [Micromonospora sp. CPCC 205558]|uniref:hypothetical protein n=1 Tax=Micromonospora sp. CPCC 205558 TaxID=3122403 RepID=UPI002FEEAFCF